MKQAEKKKKIRALDLKFSRQVKDWKKILKNWARGGGQNVAMDTSRVSKTVLGGWGEKGERRGKTGSKGKSSKGRHVFEKKIPETSETTKKRTKPIGGGHKTGGECWAKTKTTSAPVKKNFKREQQQRCESGGENQKPKNNSESPMNHNWPTTKKLQQHGKGLTIVLKGREKRGPTPNAPKTGEPSMAHSGTFVLGDRYDWGGNKKWVEK